MRDVLTLKRPLGPQGPTRIPHARGDCAVTNELHTIARTLWGMARQDGLEAMAGVGNVILNRFELSKQHARWWGSSLTEICMKPGVFPCWRLGSEMRLQLEGNPSLGIHPIDEDNPRYCDALLIAREMLHGELSDRTKGADYVQSQSGRTLIAPHADRTKRPHHKIGTLLFYRLES